MTPLLDTDIVVVAYNSADTLPDSLHSARSASGVNRIVVVDNASRDASARVARSCGATIVVENDSNLGFAAAVNVGLRFCESEFVLLLNPDAVLPPDALRMLRQVLLHDPLAAIAGPSLLEGRQLILGARRFSQLLPRVIQHYPLLGRIPLLTRREEYRESCAWRASSATRAVDYVWGAACLIRRRFLLQVGGLDERYFMYCEDEDLGRLARAQGCTVILAPMVVVPHIGGASSCVDPAAATAQQISSLYQLFGKWHGATAASAYLRLTRLGLHCRALSHDFRRRNAKADFVREVLEHLRAMPTSAWHEPG